MVMPRVESQMTVNLAPAQEPPPQINSQRRVSLEQMESQLVIIARVDSEAETVKDVLQDTLGTPHMDSAALLQVVVLVIGEAALKPNVMPVETADASPTWKARLVTLVKEATSS